MIIPLLQQSESSSEYDDSADERQHQSPARDKDRGKEHRAGGPALAPFDPALVRRLVQPGTSSPRWTSARKRCSASSGRFSPAEAVRTTRPPRMLSGRNWKAAVP